MVNRFLGLLVLIDTGMSGGVDYSTGSLLRIRRGGDSDVYSISFGPDGRKEELLMATKVLGTRVEKN